MQAVATIWDDQDDDQQQQDSQAIRQLREHSKNLEKQLKALMEERDQLRGLQREKTLTEALSARNLPSKIAEIIPEEIGSDSEAVTRWLDKYADVLGVTATGEGQDPSEDATPVGVSGEDVEQLQAMNRVVSQSSAPSALSDVASKLQAVQSTAELDMLVLGRVRD